MNTEQVQLHRTPFGYMVGIQDHYDLYQLLRLASISLFVLNVHCFAQSLLQCFSYPDNYISASKSLELRLMQGTCERHISIFTLLSVIVYLWRHIPRPQHWLPFNFQLSFKSLFPNQNNLLPNHVWTSFPTSSSLRIKPRTTRSQINQIKVGKKPEDLGGAEGVAFDAATALSREPGPLSRELWHGCVNEFGRDGTDYRNIYGILPPPHLAINIRY